MAFNPAYIDFDLNPFDEAAELAANRTQFSTRVDAGVDEMIINGPAITRPPQDASGAVGATVTFTVTAIGSGTLTYQWQLKSSATASWKNTSMPGATTITLSVAVTAARDGYQYRCVVTDGNGVSTASAGATLTVIS